MELHGAITLKKTKGVHNNAERRGRFYYAQEVQHKTRLCEFRTLIFCAPHHFAVFTLESYIKKSKDYFDSSQSLFTFRSFLDSFKVNFSSISRSMGSFFGFCLCPFQVHLRSIQVLSRSSFSPYQVFFRSILALFYPFLDPLSFRFLSMILQNTDSLNIVPLYF